MDGGERLHDASASLPSPSTDRMRDLSMRDLSHRVRSAGGRQTDGDCGDCRASGRGSQGKVGNQCPRFSVFGVVLVGGIVMNILVVDRDRDRDVAEGR